MQIGSSVAISQRRAGAFTLVEVVIALALTALIIGGILSSYLLSSRRAEWSAFSLAAQSLASQAIEQTRAAKWDALATPPIDEVTRARFPESVQVLDLPQSGTNIAFARVRLTISTVSTSPPLKHVRAECVWPFMGRSFTNSVSTFRAPDQ